MFVQEIIELAFGFVELFIYTIGLYGLCCGGIIIFLIRRKDKHELSDWILIIGSLAMSYIALCGFFCGLYWLAIQKDQNAFINAKSEADLMYFSIITQSTVGFGDIVPRSPHARYLVCIQVLFGHLFNLIVIGVAGAYISNRIIQKSPSRRIDEYIANMSIEELYELDERARDRGSRNSPTPPIEDPSS
jgi:hypothetical protein